MSEMTTASLLSVKLRIASRTWSAFFVVICKSGTGKVKKINSLNLKRNKISQPVLSIFILDFLLNKWHSSIEHFIFLLKWKRALTFKFFTLWSLLRICLHYTFRWNAPQFCSPYFTDSYPKHLFKITTGDVYWGRLQDKLNLLPSKKK